MVRQDRGFDPNLVDLASYRLTERTVMMSSRYQSGEEGVVFPIYKRTKDRKFCASIGSKIFSQLYLCSYDPCELSMMLCFLLRLICKTLSIYCCILQ